MAGPAPKTQLWTARENEHKPSGLHILVSGQVEVDYDKAPMLTETKGDGTVLALDLTIEQQASTEPVKDTDGKVLTMPPVWKAASFHKVVDADQFARVAIRWNNQPIETTPVIDDRECAAMMAKQTKAQNRVVPKVEKVAARKPAAGKPAAKEAVKTAAKKVVKAAKTPKKKVAKKVAKKAAKKASKKVAKKSTLKKLVRKLVKKLTPKKKGRKGKRR